MHFLLHASLFLSGATALVLPSEIRARANPTYTITWTNCSATDPPRLQCGTMLVPVDWNNPSGEKITIGMTRFKSTASGIPPLGALIMNPGGPGGRASGVVEAAAEGAPIFSDDLQAQYDIIGLDPRGVGMSTNIRCDPNVWNQRSGVTQFPSTDAEFNALKNYNLNLGLSCKNLTGALFDHMSTLEVAKDFDAFRQAVGSRNPSGKLNFLAFSYGTQIAVQYATLFPSNVGRFVLDGNVDHSGPEIAPLLVEANTFEKTLLEFFKWCNAASSSDCPIQGSASQRSNTRYLENFFDNLINSADASPMSVSSCAPNTCFPVAGADILANVQGMLIGPDINGAWPMLAGALQQLSGGDASAFVAAKATSDKSSNYANIAVGCQDWFHSSNSVWDIKLKNLLVSGIAPHTKGVCQSYTYQVSCIGWPAPLSNPPNLLPDIRFSAKPMLIVNALYDPATSYQWAQSVALQFPQSVLLTRDGSGHTSYPIGGVAAGIIENFLLTNTLPARGTHVSS
jgi:pimeloyl-ACP methyl ester carboxylesterase